MNKINRQITSNAVLLIDENGEQLGTYSLSEAQKLAQEKKLDLVEVGRGTCKIMDFKKHQYQKQKNKKAKHAPDLKEFRFRVNIADHDIEVKAKQMSKLLTKGHPIRIVIRFVGREITHMEGGYKVFHKLQQFLSEFSFEDLRKEGRQLVTIVKK